MKCIHSHKSHAYTHIQFQFMLLQQTVHDHCADSFMMEAAVRKPFFSMDSTCFLYLSHTASVSTMAKSRLSLLSF